MELYERIKFLRKEKLHLSQSALGERLGVSRDVISNIENNRLVNPEQKEPIIKLICAEFNVNPYWLKDGKGEIFNDIPETLLDELADEYNLDDLQLRLVKVFIEMNEEERNILTNYIKKVIEE